MRIFSYGGGVQSNAALVLAATSRLGADAFIFADVGEDSEHPDTVTYVRDIARPYAKQHGISFETVRHLFNKRPETLLQHIYRPDRHGIPIPARLNGGAPVRRLCTSDWKVRPIEKWLMKQGAGPHEVMLGISLDEFRRMRSNEPDAIIRRTYPLIELRMTRADCIRTIEDAGLPVPPKSSCWFCPYHSLDAWRELRNDRPDLFAAAEHLERRLTERVAHRGNYAYLTDTKRPLGMALEQKSEQNDDACDSGYCFT